MVGRGGRGKISSEEKEGRTRPTKSRPISRGKRRSEMVAFHLIERRKIGVVQLRRETEGESHVRGKDDLAGKKESGKAEKFGSC